MTKLKICGLKRMEDVEYINQVRPDFAGFIINYPKSRRSIDVPRLKQLSASLDHHILPVGVFVDEPVTEVIDLLCDGVIRGVQLHGNENDVYISRLMNHFQSHDQMPLVIKAIRVLSSDDIYMAERCRAPMVLLDGGAGDGISFDWSLLKDVRRPYILAGGLNADNVGFAIRRLAPWGVDVSSGVESNGMKDPDKVMRFASVVHKIDNEIDERIG